MVHLAIKAARNAREAARAGKLQREATAELEHSRQFLEAVLENVQDGIVACNADGKLSFFNRATREFHGVDREELSPEQWASKYDLYDADGTTPLETENVPLFRALNGEVVKGRHMVIAPRGGEPRHILASGRALYDSSGMKLGAVVSMHDVTAQLQAETELRRERAELKLIFDNVPVRIFFKDDKNRILKLNEPAAKSIGLTVTEAEGADTYDLFPEMAKKYHDDDLRVINGGEPMLGIVEEYTPADGARGWVHTDKVPYYDSETGERFLFVAATDITAVKQAEAALERSEEQFRMAIDRSAIGMALVAPDGGWLRVNPALTRMLGYSEEELLAIDFQTITHPDDLDADLGLVGQMLDREIESYQMEKRYLCKDGNYLWALLSVALVWDTDDTPLHFIAQIQDISERKQRDAEIRELNEQLEERVRRRTTELETANAELAAFSYSVSHDLRAPLRSIDGFSRAIAEDYRDKLDEDGQDYIRRICAATERMGALIDDMLKLSRLSREELECQPIDVSALADKIATEIKESNPERRATFEIAPGMTAAADDRQIPILLDNLLRNAWKYSSDKDEARIEVGQKTEGGETVFFVRDNGVGFDMAYADKLFKPFQRLHSDSEFEGTGIGLATVARIVRRHGGRIWAEASLGQGAAFYFTLTTEREREAA